MHSTFDMFTAIWAEVGQLVAPDKINDARDCLYDFVLEFGNFVSQEDTHRAVVAHFKRKWCLS